MKSEIKGKRLGSIGTGSVFRRLAGGLKEAEPEGIKVGLTAVADVVSVKDMEIAKEVYGKAGLKDSQGRWLRLKEIE